MAGGRWCLIYSRQSLSLIEALGCNLSQQSVICISGLKGARQFVLRACAVRVTYVTNVDARRSENVLLTKQSGVLFAALLGSIDERRRSISHSIVPAVYGASPVCVVTAVCVWYAGESVVHITAAGGATVTLIRHHKFPRRCPHTNRTKYGLVILL